MKIKLSILIIFCIFINLFSFVSLNAQESSAISSVVLDNTMKVAKNFFVTYCISTTVDIVMGKITYQNSVTTPAKNKSNNKSKTNNDLDRTFLVQTAGSYSGNILESKAITGFYQDISRTTNDIKFTILFRKFMQRSFIFLILMAMLCLLPRGAIDNYALLNINSRIR
ncbi:MAG: hypothetical protein LHV68_04290 [Elusimicrobia bacterium]|nr:hypothetical protein [Candidatus Liberimonas magnetica]